ncbi:MAG: YihY/virulence factor BrkB family protein [Bryobacterales bacterium]|nr:YihY/virulence factor BrkB family protein [Bryobacterales bacterium]
MDKLVEEVTESALELKSDWRHLSRYLLETEVHVYAFSIAGNVLLAFLPFMSVMLWILRYGLGWSAAELALYGGIRDIFPGETGAFLTYNLRVIASYSRQLAWYSLPLLLFTANGIFLPLEVALNRAWGVKVNRSLLKNQVVSMGLIFACGGLVLAIAAMAGYAQSLWGMLSEQDIRQFARDVETSPRASYVPFAIAFISKLSAITFTMVSLFLVFCFLPNTAVPKRRIVPRVILIGLALEVLKWINMFTWPWVYAKLSREYYSVFVNSATILTWSFLAGLVVLAGADWTARRCGAASVCVVTGGGVTGPIPGAPFQDRIDSESVL